MTRMDETLNEWLRDAHAMEKQAEQMLKTQASRLDSYPDLRARIQRHVEETQRQRERLEGCLKARGTSSSAMKDMTGQATAMMQGLGGMAASDEVVKGAMAGYTFEHMEISAYKNLIAAAKAVGDEKTASVCEDICREEEAMAAWLADHQAKVTREYLGREAQSRVDAKR